jgi:hypothetical protein
MHERAKKSSFYVAYTQIDEETFACDRKILQTVLRVYAYTLQSQRNHSLTLPV